MVFVECDVPLVLVCGCVGSTGFAVSTPTYAPIHATIPFAVTALSVYGAGSEARTTCEPAQMKLVQSISVKLLGGVNVPLRLNPTTMTRTSFSCAPAGLFTLMLFPFSTVAVAVERNQIGPCFFTAAVTVQVRAVAGGFSVIVFVAPTADASDVAVSAPVAVPLAATSRSFISNSALLAFDPVLLPESTRSVIPPGGVHPDIPPDVAATPCSVTSIVCAAPVVTDSAVCDVPLGVVCSAC